MMISVGSCSRQDFRQRIRMSGSSWNDGTMTEVVVRKSLTMAGAVAERITRYSHSNQTMVPAIAIGMYGTTVTKKSPTCPRVAVMSACGADWARTALKIAMG